MLPPRPYPAVLYNLLRLQGPSLAACLLFLYNLSWLRRASLCLRCLRSNSLAQVLALQRRRITQVSLPTRSSFGPAFSPHPSSTQYVDRVVMRPLMVFLPRGWVPVSAVDFVLCNKFTIFCTEPQLTYSSFPTSIFNMAVAVAVQSIRNSVRHFSAHRPPTDSRTSRFVATSCLVSMVVLPFVPPALESSRERNMGYPHHNKYAPETSQDNRTISDSFLGHTRSHRSVSMPVRYGVFI